MAVSVFDRVKIIMRKEGNRPTANRSFLVVQYFQNDLFFPSGRFSS